MKYNVLIGIVVVILLVFSGCTTQQQNGNQGNNNQETAPSGDWVKESGINSSGDDIDVFYGAT